MVICGNMAVEGFKSITISEQTYNEIEQIRKEVTKLVTEKYQIKSLDKPLFSIDNIIWMSVRKMYTDGGNTIGELILNDALYKVGIARGIPCGCKLVPEDITSSCIACRHPRRRHDENGCIYTFKIPIRVVEPDSKLI